MPGICTSMQTTSGRSEAAASTALTPSRASPTTSMPGSLSRMARNPAAHELLVVDQQHADRGWPS